MNKDAMTESKGIKLFNKLVSLIKEEDLDAPDFNRTIILALINLNFSIISSMNNSIPEKLKIVDLFQREVKKFILKKEKHTKNH